MIIPQVPASILFSAKGNVEAGAARKVRKCQVVAQLRKAVGRPCKCFGRMACMSRFCSQTSKASPSSICDFTTDMKIQFDPMISHLANQGADKHIAASHDPAIARKRANGSLALPRQLAPFSPLHQTCRSIYPLLELHKQRALPRNGE